MYKKLDDTILIAITVKEDVGVMVSTMYDLNNLEYKISNRLENGRIKQFK